MRAQVTAMLHHHRDSERMDFSHFRGSVNRLRTHIFSEYHIKVYFAYKRTCTLNYGLNVCIFKNPVVWHGSSCWLSTKCHRHWLVCILPSLTFLSKYGLFQLHKIKNAKAIPPNSRLPNIIPQTNRCIAIQCSLQGSSELILVVILRSCYISNEFYYCQIYSLIHW